MAAKPQTKNLPELVIHTASGKVVDENGALAKAIKDVRESTAWPRAAATTAPRPRLEFPVVLSVELSEAESFWFKTRPWVYAATQVIIKALPALIAGVPGKTAGLLSQIAQKIADYVENDAAPKWPQELDGLLDADHLPPTETLNRWLGRDLRTEEGWKDLPPLTATKEEWLQFIEKLRTSRTLIQEQVAKPGSGSGKASSGASLPTKPKDNPAAKTSPELANSTANNTRFVHQLHGWLYCGGDDVPEYTYELTGPLLKDFTPHRGRLDILGPDGAQLFTRALEADDTEAALLDSSYKLEIGEAEALREALETVNLKAQENLHAVPLRGRVFDTRGRALAQRQIAAFVPVPPVNEAPSAAAQDPCGCSEPVVEETTAPRARPIPAALAQAILLTDENGYFNGACPLPSNTVAVELHIAGVLLPQRVTLVKGRFPDPLLLSIDEDWLLPEAPKNPAQRAGDCSDQCYAGARYEPNRSLAEFFYHAIVRTSDPLIARTDNSGNSHPDFDTFFRRPLNREQPLMWDKPLERAQSVSISHGRLLTYRQVWRHDGYALGSLLYSLPLAPLQRKNIIVHDWDRSDRSHREEEIERHESLRHDSTRTRDIHEIVDATLRETVQGGSSAGSSGFGIGLGGGALGAIGGALVSVAGGLFAGKSNANASSSQSSSRAVASDVLNQLRDRTSQSAVALSRQRVTMVVQTDQSDSTRQVSESVVNPNSCHALTMQYYEVQQKFLIEHELAAVQECLFIPLPFAPFDGAKALRWRTLIDKALLDSELAPALAACERLADDEDKGTGKLPVYPAQGHYASETMLDLRGSLELVLEFPERYDTQGNFDGAVQASYEALLGAGQWTQLYTTAVAALPADQRTASFHRIVGSALAQRFVSELKVLVVTGPRQWIDLAMVPGLEGTYTPGGTHTVRLWSSANLPQLTRESVLSLMVVTPIAGPTVADLTLTGVHLRYRTKRLEHSLLDSAYESQRIGGQPAAGVAVAPLATPLSDLERADAKSEDQLAESRLIRHLNEHLEHYHRTIWSQMDADRRLGLLDGIVAPRSGGRSLASVVENRVIAVVGNALVMPVTQGIRLDPYQEQEDVPASEDGDLAPLAGKETEKSTDNADGAFSDLLSLYKRDVQEVAQRITVPTRGVFAEAVMGCSNSCEQVDPTRIGPFPVPDPPAVDAAAWSNRYQAPTMSPVEFKSILPTELLAKALELLRDDETPTRARDVIENLVKASAFADGRGLEKTQELARDAFKQSAESALGFGKVAMEPLKAFMAAKSAPGGGTSGQAPQKTLSADPPASERTLLQAEPLNEMVSNAQQQGSSVRVADGERSIEIGSPSARGGLLSRLFGTPAFAAPPAPPRKAGRSSLSVFELAVLRDDTRATALGTNWFTTGRLILGPPQGPGEQLGLTLEHPYRGGRPLNESERHAPPKERVALEVAGQHRQWDTVARIRAKYNIQYSAVMAGTYSARVRIDIHDNGDEVWRIELINTGLQTNIQIHAGNWLTQITGCILVGKHFLVPPPPSGKLPRPHLAESGAVMKKLRELYGEDLNRPIRVHVVGGPLHAWGDTEDGADVYR